ncbi:hypothetical protein [Enterovirga aerilata]|uniref:Uncharacterized protein n=1 Tax=Enterovirga aerilata TaxID=2730920 RepID=A0A849I4S6_9HYPH|nr:hypothetical protein [Enterovirga sp. DB1703]NNM71389.1 hypothetical protein [Enterovirga sp. DB1703]
MRELPQDAGAAVKLLADEVKRLNGKVAALEAYVASLHGTVTRDPEALRRFADYCCKERPAVGSAEYDWACATLDTLMHNRWCDPRP